MDLYRQILSNQEFSSNTIFIFQFLCYKFLQSKHQKFAIPLFSIPVFFTLSSFLCFLRFYVFFLFLCFLFLHTKWGLKENCYSEEWTGKLQQANRGRGEERRDRLNLDET
jgi:hypothetical protein